MLRFSYDDAVIETVAKRCTDVDSGARNVYNILTGTMLPDMCGEVLGEWRGRWHHKGPCRCG